MFSEVRICQVANCYYNHDALCTARSITVGHGSAKCETWMTALKMHSPKMNSALVGACHEGECMYNQNFFCHAVNDIEVDMSDGEAQCMTYCKK